MSIYVIENTGNKDRKISFLGTEEYRIALQRVALDLKIKDVQTLLEKAVAAFVDSAANSNRAGGGEVDQKPTSTGTKSPLADDPFAVIQSQYSKTVDQVREKFMGGMELLEHFKAEIEQVGFHVATGDFEAEDHASRPVRTELRKHGKKPKRRPQDSGASEGAA